MVEALLDSGATELVISSEFARKQGFKLKKIEKSIYIRNMNILFNKEGPIKHMVEVNIYYQGHRERMEIDIIGSQKWSVILEMPQLACHNSEINWKIGEVRMIRCPEKCEKQYKSKQGKVEWQKQKEKEAKEEVERKQEEKEKEKKTEEGENNRYEESSREVGNLG